MNVCCAFCRDDDDKVVFKGWARMALPIEQFSIIEVRKPNVGENKPAGVEADVIVDLKGTGHAPWSGYKHRDMTLLQIHINFATF